MMFSPEERNTLLSEINGLIYSHTDVDLADVLELAKGHLAPYVRVAVALDADRGPDPADLELVCGELMGRCEGYMGDLVDNLNAIPTDPHDVEGWPDFMRETRLHLDSELEARTTLATIAKRAA